MTIVNGYCTLADIKNTNRLNFNDSDSLSDEMLEGIIEAVSRRIDDECHRFFYSDSDDVSRYYTALSSEYVFTDDICSPSSDIGVIIDDGTGTYPNTFAFTDFYPEPFNAELDGVPYQKLTISYSGNHAFPKNIRKGVKVTAKFGWSSVPKPIQQACMLQSERLFKRFSTPLGSESMSTLGKMYLTIPKLDPDVELLISRYIKPVFG